MAGISVLILIAVVFTAATAQRNNPSSTTSQSALTESTSEGSVSTTEKSWPYAAAGFRPGRAFELPSEEKPTTETIVIYWPPTRNPKAYTPAPTPIKPTSSYGPPTRDARASTPAPASTTTTTTTAKPHHSYGPPARDGRAFTPPPTADPLPTYLPPSDKYGPAAEDTPTTTPADPELIEPTTQRAPTPRNLGNGFYFIRLPNGFISRTGLLSVAASDPQNTTAPEEDISDVETFEPVNPAPSAVPPSPDVSIAPVRPLVASFSPIDPVLPAVQFQPVLQTQQSSVQFWPPQQPQTIVISQPENVHNNPEYVKRESIAFTSERGLELPFVQKWPSRQPEKIVAAQPILRSESLGEAYAPVLYFQPQGFSYTSQYRSW